MYLQCIIWSKPIFWINQVLDFNTLDDEDPPRKSDHRLYPCVKIEGFSFKNLISFQIKVIQPWRYINQEILSFAHRYLPRKRTGIKLSPLIVASFVDSLADTGLHVSLAQLNFKNKCFTNKKRYVIPPFTITSMQRVYDRKKYSGFKIAKNIFSCWENPQGSNSNKFSFPSSVYMHISIISQRLLFPYESTKEEITKKKT